MGVKWGSGFWKYLQGMEKFIWLHANCMCMCIYAWYDVFEQTDYLNVQTNLCQQFSLSICTLTWVIGSHFL